MKRFYLVRHAQTAWNSDNRIQGHSDLPLSELGRQQAHELAAHFAICKLKGVASSALQRSLQTANAIARGNGKDVQIRVEPDLAEMHLGSWEGLTPEEIDARFQGAYQQWCLRPSAVRIPSAETLAVCKLRCKALLRH